MQETTVCTAVWYCPVPRFFMAKTAVARLARKTKYELTPCVICGSREAVAVANRADLQREMERVWAFHNARFRHPVPPKYLTDRVVFSQLPAWRLVRCASCTHLYRSPRETPETVKRTYSEDALSESVYESAYARQSFFYRAQVERLLAFAGRVQHGLEVGSYTGGFLAAALEAGLSFTGIDVNPGATAFGARHGLPIATCSLEELNPSQMYDAIVIWNTFEQLSDVKSACLVANRLLRKGGVLAVRVPNSAFYTRWRHHLNDVWAPWAERMLVHNNLLGFPYREGFTARSLSRLLKDSGFTIGRVQGDTLVRVSDGWTKRAAVLDEWVTKEFQRLTQRGWEAPWVEVYATTS